MAAWIAVGALAVIVFGLAGYILWGKVKEGQGRKLQQLQAQLQQADGLLQARGQVVVALALKLYSGTGKNTRSVKIPKSTLNQVDTWDAKAQPLDNGGLEIVLERKGPIGKS